MGVFAIAGIYPWAGFFSKDEILYQTFIWDNPLSKLLWFVGLVTAFLTAFYMFRLWFKTFFGPYRFEDKAAHGHGVMYADSHAHAVPSLEDHGAPVHASGTSTLVMEAEHDSGQVAHSHGVHESSWIMLVPLILLAILSVAGGWVGIPYALEGHNEMERFLAPVFDPASVPLLAASTEIIPLRGGHVLEVRLAFVSLLTAGIGLFAAYYLYYRKRGLANDIAKKAGPAYSVLSHKYWVDEIYGALVISPLLFLSRFVLGGLVDAGIVQGAGSAAGGTTRGLSSLARRMQSGNIRSYAGWLALGAAVVILITLFGIHPFSR
jgi:NADH-quinone oxidoreductase subunit L